MLSRKKQREAKKQTDFNLPSQLYSTEFLSSLRILRHKIKEIKHKHYDAERKDCSAYSIKMLACLEQVIDILVVNSYQYWLLKQDELLASLKVIMDDQFIPYVFNPQSRDIALATYNFLDSLQLERCFTRKPPIFSVLKQQQSNYAAYVLQVRNRIAQYDGITIGRKFLSTCEQIINPMRATEKWCVELEGKLKSEVKPKKQYSIAVHYKEKFDAALQQVAANLKKLNYKLPYLFLLPYDTQVKQKAPFIVPLHQSTIYKGQAWFIDIIITAQKKLNAIFIRYGINVRIDSGSRYVFSHGGDSYHQFFKARTRLVNILEYYRRQLEDKEVLKSCQLVLATQQGAIINTNLVAILSKVFLKVCEILQGIDAKGAKEKNEFLRLFSSSSVNSLQVKNLLTSFLHELSAFVIELDAANDPALIEEVAPYFACASEFAERTVSPEYNSVRSIGKGLNESFTTSQRKKINQLPYSALKLIGKYVPSKKKTALLLDVDETLLFKGESYNHHLIAALKKLGVNKNNKSIDVFLFTHMGPSDLQNIIMAPDAYISREQLIQCLKKEHNILIKNVITQIDCNASYPVGFGYNSFKQIYKEVEENKKGTVEERQAVLKKINEKMQEYLVLEAEVVKIVAEMEAYDIGDKTSMLKVLSDESKGEYDTFICIDDKEKITSAVVKPGLFPEKVCSVLSPRKGVKTSFYYIDRIAAQFVENKPIDVAENQLPQQARFLVEVLCREVFRNTHFRKYALLQLHNLYSTIHYFANEKFLSKNMVIFLDKMVDKVVKDGLIDRPPRFEAPAKSSLTV